MQCTDECLFFWPSNCALFCVAFGLNIHAVEPECVLVDYPVNSSIIRELSSCCFT